jgi:hypothetical protein
MKSDKSAYLPLGLVFGLGLGAVCGNPALGSLFGMVLGLIFSNSGRSETAN